MLTTYVCRIEFVGKNSGLRETKEFAFQSEAERLDFMFVAEEGGCKVTATWTETIYTVASQALGDLLRAINLPVN